MEPITEAEKRFADEYLLDLNPRAAFVRAGLGRVAFDDRGRLKIGMEVEGIQVISIERNMLARPAVKLYIDTEIAKRRERLELTVDNVVRRFWAIATADPNEVVSVNVKACRHCYGLDFRYLFKDEVEFAQYVQSELVEAHKEGRGPRIPMYPQEWYDWTAAPNPKCPRCEGRGEPEMVVADTTRLQGSARLLYAGVKQGKNGLEIKLRDQDAALVAIGKYLGVTPETLNLAILQGRNAGGLQPLTPEQLKKLTPAEFNQLMKVMEKLNAPQIDIENPT